MFGYEYEELATGRRKFVLWSESGSTVETISVNSGSVQVTNLITDLNGNIQEQYILPAIAGGITVIVGEEPLLIEELISE